MATPADDTDALLTGVAAGDRSSAEALLDRHRGRLAAMVRLRMDRRLAARLDASDVVQDVLAEAFRKLPRFAAQPSAPFYLWLRSIAWERLIQLYRRHVTAQRRTITREEPRLVLAEGSEIVLADRFVAATSGADRSVLRRETCDRVRAALQRLPDAAREVVILRHLEDLPFKDVAIVLGVTETAVYSRYRRAVEQLSRLLRDAD